MTVAQMTKIKLDEISLVDYPAHMVNGFPVIKSASTEHSDSIMDALGKRNTEMPVADLAKALAEASVDDIVKALAERTDIIVKSADADADEQDGTDEDKVMKSLSPEVRAIIEKRDAELSEFKKAAEEAEQKAEIAKAAQLDGEAIAKSKELTNLAFDHETVAPALRKFAEANPEAGEAIDTMLKAVNAQADGAIFKEIGTRAVVTKSEPEAALETLAKAMVTEGKETNYHDAFAKAVADPANKELVDAHFKAGN